MPEQKPGRSKQDYVTPNEFMLAVQGRFGMMDFDLAADETNNKAVRYFNETDNSLIQDWNLLEGNLWLNPPFADIGSWAKKCAATETTRCRHIFLLVPASVGSDWYRFYVETNAFVLALSPRLTFVGCDDPYPKDLALCCYMHGLVGFRTWRWK